MKKKLLFFILSLVCAVTCAFGLVACGGGESNMVACTLTSTPEHISQVNLISENENVKSLGAAVGIWELPRQIDKNKELKINVYLDDYYEIGTLKMFINGTETALNDDGNVGYTCTYTPTTDFTITFSGEAKLKTTTVTFNAIDWQPCYDYYSGQDNATAQGDALKEKIKNNVRIKVLVNDVEKMPFNGMNLLSFESALSANSVVSINMGDNVEIQLYTDSNELTLDTFVYDIEPQCYNVTTSADKKNCTAKTDNAVYAVTVTIKAFIYPV